MHIDDDWRMMFLLICEAVSTCVLFGAAEDVVRCLPVFVWRVEERDVGGKGRK